MDAKITKKRLNDLLSYDWIKIIALGIAGIVIWYLIFTMAAVRLSVGQQFKIFLYSDVYAGSNFYDFSASLKADGVLSYDILSNSSESLTSDTANTVLSARFAVDEGDIMILTNKSVLDDDGNDTGTGSSFKSFVDGYSIGGSPARPGGYSLVYDIDRLIEDAEAYLSDFIVKQNGQAVITDGKPQLNAENLEANFRRRMKKDNRFKKQSQIAAGLVLEAERIVVLYNAVEEFKTILSENPDLRVNYKRNEQLLTESEQTGIETGPELTYGINLSGVKDITEIVATGQAVAENIVLTVLDRRAKQPDLQYEVIPVIVKILKYGG